MKLKETIKPRKVKVVAARLTNQDYLRLMEIDPRPTYAIEKLLREHEDRAIKRDR